MIEILKASPTHVEGIAKVCREANWATYKGLRSEEYIKRVIKEFYNHERILKEVSETGKEWGGYFVAVEGDVIIGAIGGGMIGENTGEVFVLYLDPNRRSEGIGTKLLKALTHQQKEEHHATEQWVSVAKGNQKGIPFYEARGFQFINEQREYGTAEGENYISLRYVRKIEQTDC